MGHVFLYGPPGVGKTTIGQILAEKLKLAFVDLDQVIEADAGMSIPHIIETRAESRFRDLETAALANVLDAEEKVIALGGGALLRDHNREIAEKHGTVIVLMAGPEILLERLNSDPNKRPLLSGDLRGRLEQLLLKRAGHYQSFATVIHVNGKTGDQTAEDIQSILGRYHLSAMGEYDVLVRNNGIRQIGVLLQRRGLKNPIVVTDENVEACHGETVLTCLQAAGFDSRMLTIPSGEAGKNLATVNQLWQHFLEAGVDRKSTVIGVGGGVVGDLAGFAAATYMRGIDWVCLPTTLLSMVDASLGGKTGFDLPEGKNLIGSFHAPKLVVADPQVLGTLPEVEFVAGLAEVVKHGIISDPELFNVCARGLAGVKSDVESVVKRAMAVKIGIIEEDPYEKRFRAALNLGHTVGHAVELVSGFKLRHGEAVSIGMVAEAKLAERLTVAGKGLSDTVAEVLSSLGLPIHIPRELPRQELIQVMQMDKKKHVNRVRFALPVEIGKVELVDVTDLEKVFEE